MEDRLDLRKINYITEKIDMDENTCIGFSLQVVQRTLDLFFKKTDIVMKC